MCRVVGVGVCVIGVQDKLTVGVTLGVTLGVGVEEGHNHILIIVNGALYPSTIIFWAQTYSELIVCIDDTLTTPVHPVYL